MVVKIIIDRKVKKGKEAEFFDLLKELRSKAVSSKGYISGETLEPCLILITMLWSAPGRVLMIGRIGRRIRRGRRFRQGLKD